MSNSRGLIIFLDSHGKMPQEAHPRLISAILRWFEVILDEVLEDSQRQSNPSIDIAVYSPQLFEIVNQRLHNRFQLF